MADGVDTISLSQGYDEHVPFHESALAIAFFGAMEKGICVSHVAGNASPHLGSIYDTMPWNTMVAAGSVDQWFAGTLALGNGLIITGWSTFPWPGVMISSKDGNTVINYAKNPP